MKIRNILGAALVAASLVAPAAANAQGYFVGQHAYVISVAPWDVLNVRKWPAAYSRKVGAIPHHGEGIYVQRCIVRPHGSRSDWCKVSYYGTWGWVNSRFLAWH